MRSFVEGGDAGHRQGHLDLGLLGRGEGAHVGGVALALSPAGLLPGPRPGGGDVREQLLGPTRLEDRAARDGEAHRRRRVEGAVVLEQLLAGRLLDDPGEAGRRPGDGLPAPEGDGAEPVPDPAVGVGQPGGELLEHHVALPLDLLDGEEGAAQHVGDDVGKLVHRRRRALGVVADLLGVGVGVGRRSQPVDLPGDLLGGGTALGALVEHVLQVVGQAGGLGGLVARPRADDQEDADVAARRRRVEQGDAVGQGGRPRRRQIDGGGAGGSRQRNDLRSWACSGKGNARAQDVPDSQEAR